MIDQLVTTGWHIRIIKIAAVIIGAFICYRSLKFFIYRNDKSRADRDVDRKTLTYKRIMINLARTAITLIALMLTLKLAGFNIQSLVTGLGLPSVVVGLAVQDVLKDLIRGINILGDSYFHIGDVVRFKDQEGEIISMNLLSTKIRSLHTYNILTVANRHFEEAEVVSSFYLEKVPMPYDLKVYQAEMIIRDIVRRIRKNEYVDSCRYVGVTELGESCIYYYLEIRSDPIYRRQVSRDTLRSILLGLEEKGVSVPYPQMDVHAIDGAERKAQIDKIVSSRDFKEFEEKNKGASSDSLFRTEKYRAMFTGDNTGEILDGVEHFSWRMGCTAKEKLQLRLLAEELLELVKNTTEKSILEMTYTEKGRVCRVRIRMDSEMDAELRRKIASLAELGSIPPDPQGIMDRLTALAARLLSSGSPESGRVWSMREFINSVNDEEFPGSLEEREKALAELETSIIAKLADEVVVKYNHDEVVLEAEKRL